MSTALSSAAALRLSEEAQDLICSHVASFSNTDAMNTLYSLALTSKAFLESAQHALYKAPLRALLARPTWPRAEALLLTLQTRPGLALHIRQLYALEPVAKGLSSLQSVSSLSEPTNNLVEVVGALSLAEGSKEAACSWGLKVAHVATNTASLSSPMRSQSHAERWATIIPSLSRVLSLRMSGKAPFAIDFPTFEKLASNWDGKKMKKVSLVGLDWPEVATNGSKFRLPSSAKELFVEDAHLTARQLSLCLPHTLTTLKSLTLSSYGPRQGGYSERQIWADLKALFKTVGKHLRTLSFSALHQHEVRDDIESYGFSHNGPFLPLAAFQAFPLVTSLTLRYLADMTPTILAEIARSSPKLKTLDLKWTTWDELEFDGMEDPLIKALDGFGQLSNLDLGYFRVIEDDPWEIECIMEWADEKGVVLEWQGCDYPDEDFDGSGYGSEEFCYDSDCDGECGYVHGWEFD